MTSTQTTFESFISFIINYQILICLTRFLLVFIRYIHLFLLGLEKKTLEKVNFNYLAFAERSF